MSKVKRSHEVIWVVQRKLGESWANTVFLETRKDARKEASIWNASGFSRRDIRVRRFVMEPK